MVINIIIFYIVYIFSLYSDINWHLLYNFKLCTLKIIIKYKANLKQTKNIKHLAAMGYGKLVHIPIGYSYSKPKFDMEYFTKFPCRYSFLKRVFTKYVNMLFGSQIGIIINIKWKFPAMCLLNFTERFFISFVGLSNITIISSWHLAIFTDLRFISHRYNLVSCYNNILYSFLT